MSRSYQQLDIDCAWADPTWQLTNDCACAGPTWQLTIDCAWADPTWRVDWLMITHKQILSGNGLMIAHEQFLSGNFFKKWLCMSRSYLKMIAHERILSFCLYFDSRGLNYFTFTFYTKQLSNFLQIMNTILTGNWLWVRMSRSYLEIDFWLRMSISYSAIDNDCKWGDPTWQLTNDFMSRSHMAID